MVEYTRIGAVFEEFFGRALTCLSDQEVIIEKKIEPVIHALSICFVFPMGKEMSVRAQRDTSLLWMDLQGERNKIRVKGGKCLRYDFRETGRPEHGIK